MKHFFLFLVTTLLLNIQQQARSQASFEPGYVITLNADTLKGFLFQPESRSTIQICSFKPHADSVIREFLPDDIDGFRFLNGKYYVSRSILREDGKTEKLFLEFLIEGITSVYYYFDVKEHYFIQKNVDELTELPEEVIVVEENGKSYLRRDRYQGFLKFLMSDRPDMYKDIEQTKLSHASLIDLAKDYHNKVCDTGNCIIYVSKPTKAKLHLGPAIGILMTDYKFGWFQQTEYSIAQQAGLNLMLTDFLNNSKRFTLRSGVYAEFNNSEQHYTPIDNDNYLIEYEGQQYNFGGNQPASDTLFPRLNIIDLKIPIVLAWEFVKSKHMSLAFGAGFTTKTLLHSNPTYHDLIFEKYKGLSISKFRTGGIVTLGLDARVTEHHILSLQAGYEYFFDAGSMGSKYRIASNQFSFQLGWYF